MSYAFCFLQMIGLLCRRINHFAFDDLGQVSADADACFIFV